jgi:hypothetical protein
MSSLFKSVRHLHAVVSWGATTLAIASTVLIGTPAQLVAQDAPRPAVEVLHTPPDLRALPQAVPMLPIVIQLNNTKSIDMKVRLVGARDGRLIDIMFPRGNLNQEDFPEYRVEIPAPTAALTYQFIVHQGDGSLSTSPRFAVQRPCVQNYRVAVPEDSADAAFKRQVGDLVSKAKSLERETAQLDASMKVIDELKTALGR